MDVVLDIGREAIYRIIMVSAPTLLISLIVGLIVSIFQTVTSIQEQTLTFVPKIIAVLIVIILTGSWTIETLVEFITGLWSNFSYYIDLITS